MSAGLQACPQDAHTRAYALRALTSAEAATAELHIAACEACRDQVRQLQPIVDCVSQFNDLLRPPQNLWPRVLERIAPKDVRGSGAASSDGREPEWEQVAPGISCQLLATDHEHGRVSMLVRLAPGTDYPPHTHAGCEELYLLDGVLFIDGRTLHPGDYSRAEAGTADARVWSETGCTCVLITSPGDVLR